MLPDGQDLPGWFVQLGLMGPPLAFCSIVMVAVAFERLVFVVRRTVRRDETYQGLESHLYKHKDLPKAVRDDLVGVLLSDLHRPYHNGIKLLRLIGGISPMLGLIGTILGIIEAFKVIAAHVGPVSPSLIAEGLWEAMLTTAVGLMIALPAVLLAYLYQQFADRQLGDFCLRLNRFSLSMEVEGHRRPAEIIKTRIERPAA